MNEVERLKEHINFMKTKIEISHEEIKRHNIYVMNGNLEKDINKVLNKLKSSEKARKEAIELVKELKDETDDTTCYEINKNRKEMVLDILDIDKGE